MTADTQPRWFYHVPADTDAARRQAAARYFNRFACDPVAPRVIKAGMGVTLVYPLPGDTLEPLAVEVHAPQDGVQLEMF